MPRGGSIARFARDSGEREFTGKTVESVLEIRESHLSPRARERERERERVGATRRVKFVIWVVLAKRAIEGRYKAEQLSALRIAPDPSGATGRTLACIRSSPRGTLRSLFPTHFAICIQRPCYAFYLCTLRFALYIALYRFLLLLLLLLLSSRRQQNM